MHVSYNSKANITAHEMMIFYVRSSNQPIMYVETTFVLSQMPPMVSKAANTMTRTVVNPAT